MMVKTTRKEGSLGVGLIGSRRWVVSSLSRQNLLPPIEGNL